MISGYKLVRMPEMDIPISPTAGEGISIFYYVPQAIVLATLFLGLYWRIVGLPFFCEPGHWLLLTLSIEASHGFYTLFAMSLRFDALFDHANLLLSILPAWFAYLVVAGIYFYLWCWQHVAQHWQNFFMVAFSIEIAQMLLNVLSVQLQNYFITFGQKATFVFFGSMQVIMPLIAIAFMIVAMRKDVSLESSRHWSHWCGAIMWLTLAIVNLLSWCYYFWWIVNEVLPGLP